MSLISLITLVRNFTFTSMDHTVSHFISLFFFFNFLSIDTTGFKNKKPSTREHLTLFAFLWLNFHGAFGVCLTPPKMKTINSTVFKSEVRFQNDNKFSRLKISGYSIGYKISTKRDFEWRSIVNRIE